MKRFSLVLISLSLVVLGFFTSCTDDSTSTPPVVSFTNDVEETTVTSGSNWTVTGNISSEAGLKEVRYFTVVGNSETQKGSTVTDFDDKNSFDFTVSLTDLTATMSLKVTALDKDDQEVSKSYTITVTAPTPDGSPVSSYTAKLLGAQDNAAGSFFASVTGDVYKTSELTTSNRPKVDITYGIHQSTSKVISTSARQSLGFPAFSNSTETKYVSTTVDFGGVSDDTNIKNIDFSSGATSIAVELNKVYAFKNASGKIGIFKVVALTTGTSGSLTIDVKVQQ
jgi:hypothetical protein